MGEKWVKSKGELPAPPSTIEESTKMRLIVPSAGYALAFVRMPLPLPQAATDLPFAARVVLYYVMADFGLYWVHRLLHTKPLWRTHKWHHSPTYMYWLAGIRGSLPQQIVFTLPVMAAFPLLDLAPAWLLILIPYEAVVRNNCMHMNVTWRSNWLEWLIVTPRYHHIQHSDDPRHYTSNLGSLLTLWDRMFGTYLNPEDLEDKISFGIGEETRPVRFALGI